MIKKPATKQAKHELAQETACSGCSVDHTSDFSVCVPHQDSVRTNLLTSRAQNQQRAHEIGVRMRGIIYESEQEDSKRSYRESYGQGNCWRDPISEHAYKWAECDAKDNGAEHEIRVALADLRIILENRAHIARQIQDPERAEHHLV